MDLSREFRAFTSFAKAVKLINRSRYANVRRVPRQTAVFNRHSDIKCAEIKAPGGQHKRFLTCARKRPRLFTSAVLERSGVKDPSARDAVRLEFRRHHARSRSVIPDLVARRTSLAQLATSRNDNRFFAKCGAPYRDVFPTRRQNVTCHR